MVDLLTGYMAEKDEPPKYLRLADIECYRISFRLSNFVWQQVQTWPSLAQQTIGKQFIRSVDSISANIAEGFGRYHKKDKIHFYRIARGSLYETLDWHEKAHARTLLPPDVYAHILQTLQLLPKAINSFIKYTDSHLAI